MRLQSDLLPLLDHAVNGTLDKGSVEWMDGHAIGVVLAAGEYPAGSSKDEPITGIEEAQACGCKVFHAGTRINDGQLVTNGGRVLCATATGATLEEAKQKADAGAACIQWNGVRFRTDIAHRAIKGQS